MTHPDTPPALTLFVPGKPAAQGSKRHIGNGRLIEQSKSVRPWRKTVATHAALAYTDQPLDGALHVHIEFIRPRPTSTPKRRPTPPATTRPDLDKYVRALFDALSGIVWTDDSRVTDLHATKRLAEPGETPGAHITVRTIAQTRDDVTAQHVAQAG